ncbi:hypothetical protein [Desertivirga brevis]|uniref:hypothetical protein n=1 Tax=Desertivirga brevis TaxID=2810310 RepID=UPI001A964582|nr:hypothetical protein [Pedobacter sp. SYSU D00873]
MKIVLLSLFLFFTTLQLAAQSRMKDGSYVTTSGDTIICQIVTTPTITGKINFSALAKRLTVIENNEKKKFGPSDIKSFVVKDEQGVSHTFVSLTGDNSRFFNEVIKGKLSLYNLYSTHPYDGSTSILPIMVKDDKIVYLNVINPRQRIASLISDCPELFKAWTETDKYSPKDREAVVKAYNECGTKK